MKANGEAPGNLGDMAPVVPEVLVVLVDREVPWVLVLVVQAALQAPRFLVVLPNLMVQVAL